MYVYVKKEVDIVMSENVSECTHDCSSCSANCSSREKTSFLEPLNASSHVKHVIGVVSGKGGVGKSIVTGMLAVSMQRRGYKCAVLDADITGPSIPKLFGMKNMEVVGSEDGMIPPASKTGINVMSVNLLLENESSPVVLRGPVIAGTVKQFWTDTFWDDIDFMFVDMPPGTGDVPLTVFQSIPLDGIVIVTTPQELVSMIVSKASEMAKLMEIPVLGIVENMSYIACPDCGKQIRVFGESHVDEIAEKYGYDVLAQMPIDPRLAALCDAGILELFESDYLDRAADKVEQLEKSE